MSASSKFRIFSLLPLLAFSALAAACSSGDDIVGDESELGRDAGKGPKGALQLVVSVDWEGSDLQEANLAAMEKFHAKFPDVKVIQFLNAAYYTKPDAVATNVTKQIQRGLGPNDERGLHIHGWKRLVEASGATFVRTPNFWGSSTLSDDCSFDCGHEVPLSAYSTAELRKVVHFSVDTLNKNGFGRPVSFRCGGWMSTGTVIDALIQEGIRYDNSAVPSKFLQSEIGTLSLYRWLDALWSGTNERSQPYFLAGATSGKTKIVEVPDNGALADYMLPDEMVSVFEANKTAYLKDPSKNAVVSIGFHQETAARFLPRVEQALTEIFKRAKQQNVSVVSVTSTSLTPGS